MSLAEWSNLAQVVGTVVIIVSLIFVGLQIRQNTGALQRNEHNSTMGKPGSEYTFLLELVQQSVL